MLADLGSSWKTAPAARGVPDMSRDKVHVPPAVFLELQLLEILFRC